MLQRLTTSLTRSAIKRFSRLTYVVLVFMLSVGFFIPTFTQAASYTSVSDTLSTQAPSTTADHTVRWTTVGTHAVGDIITIDFTQADFVASGTWDVGDFAFTDNVRSAVAPAAVGTGATTCSGSAVDNYIVNVTAATSTFVIELCTGWTTSSSAVATTFLIRGTAADGLLTNQTNVDSSVFTISDGTDSGSGAVAIDTDSVVSVTASVNSSLTFSVTSTGGALPVALGTLTTGAVSTGLHTILASTNGASGLGITYNGATLTRTGSADTIDAYGATSTAPSAGTEGFGINLASNSSPSISNSAAPTTNAGATCTPAGEYDDANEFTFVAGTTTTLLTASSAADCTLKVSYAAAISTVTPAGSYTTTITYIATGTF